MSNNNGKQFSDEFPLIAKKANESIEKLHQQSLLPGIDSDTVEKNKNITFNKKGASSRAIVEQFQVDLWRSEQQGFFTQIEINNTSRFPTLLGRLPIFLPQSADEQKLSLDHDSAYPFKTPFGRGRRFGPLVTTEDEDIFLALLRLAKKRLSGKGDNLPIKVNHYLQTNKGRVDVHLAVVTITQVLKEAGLSNGGNNYSNVLSSLKRLPHVSVEIETKKQDRYFGTSWQGEVVKLVDIRWRAYEEHGVVLAQFNPLIVKWLEDERTFYKSTIRKKLISQNSKALYRFLATQGNSYEQELTYIADVIGMDRKSRERLKRSFSRALSPLEKVGWCEFNIIGNGRNQPFRLQFERLKTTLE